MQPRGQQCRKQTCQSVVSRSWSKKEETYWETCLENMEAKVMKLEIVGTCLTKHGLVGDAWSAEPWTFVFLKDSTFDSGIF